MIETYLIYNLIVIGSTVFMYLYEKTKQKDMAYLCLSISFLIIFIPAAIRYNIGTDYRTYVDIFNQAKTGNIDYIEIGWQGFNYLIIYLGLEVEWLFIFVAFITYLLLFMSYPKKYATLYHFMFMITFYLTTYTALRSAVVFSIGLIAINHYIKHKNILIFIVLTALGALFHKSILVLLAIPLLNIEGIKLILIRYKAAIFLILLAGFIFRYELINYIFNSSFIISLGYDSYANNLLFSGNTEYGSGLGIMLRCLPLLITLFYANKIMTTNTNNSVIIITVLLCFISVFMSASIEIFTRLERVFIFAYILGTVAIYQCKEIKYRAVYLMMILASQTLIFELNIGSSLSTNCSGSRVSPYVTIFNTEDDHSLKVPRTVCEMRN